MPGCKQYQENPMRRLFYRIILLLIPVFALLPGSGYLLASESSPLNPLFGPQDAAILIDPWGKMVFSRNADRPLIPASTLKIMTSLVALHHLGPDYRWVTEFYIDPASNLKVRGYGDPLLTSEALAVIADELSDLLQTGSPPIKDLVLDTSFFDQSLTVPGVTPSSEPYDAPNGALNANFNTVFFTQDSQGNYISAEPQTPLLPYALDRVRSTGLSSGRILLSNNGNEATLYTGHLIRHFLAGKGIKIHGSIRIGRVDPEKDRRIHIHKSLYSLEDAVSKLLEFSNNYMANQLLLLGGTKVHGPPGTLEKGLQAVTAYAANRLGIRHLYLVEGSGISRENRLSVGQMAKVLKAFQPYHHLLRKTDREFYKTGTLKGIRTRAGYLKNGKGEMYRFAVFVNTPGKSIKSIMNGLREMALP
jgi:D-alanyl-D-alanine carboxypeptidase/D-alanyl-D-alanine-endopeptidase (penicillin-binding protein 4)